MSREPPICHRGQEALNSRHEIAIGECSTLARLALVLQRTVVNASTLYGLTVISQFKSCCVSETVDILADVGQWFGNVDAMVRGVRVEHTSAKAQHYTAAAQRGLLGPTRLAVAVFNRDAGSSSAANNKKKTYYFEEDRLLRVVFLAFRIAATFQKMLEIRLCVSGLK